MDDPGGDPAESGGREVFDEFAVVTYTLFGNRFLVVAGGAVGGLTLFLITTVVAWSFNAGGSAPVAGLIAMVVGYVLISRLMRGLIRHLPRGGADSA